MAERCYGYRMQVEEKVEKKAEELENKMMEECTFAPKIIKMWNTEETRA